MYIYSSFFAFKDCLVCYFLGLMRCKVVSILSDAYKFKFVPLHESINNNTTICPAGSDASTLTEEGLLVAVYEVPSNLSGLQLWALNAGTTYRDFSK